MTGDHPSLMEQKSGLQPLIHPCTLGSSGNTIVLAHFPPSEGPHLSLSSSRQSTILFRSLTVFRYDSSSSFSCSFSLGVFRSSAQDKGSPSHSYRQYLPILAPASTLLQQARFYYPHTQGHILPPLTKQRWVGCYRE